MFEEINYLHKHNSNLFSHYLKKKDRISKMNFYEPQYSIIEKGGFGINNVAQYFTLKPNILFFGPFITQVYLEQEYESKEVILFKDIPLKGTIISKFPFSSKDSNHAGYTHVDEISTIGLSDIVLSHKDIIRNQGSLGDLRMDWYEMTSRRADKVLFENDINRIINLNILRIGWMLDRKGNGTFLMSSNTFQDIKDKIMRISIISPVIHTKHELHELIRNIIFFEKHWDFKLEENDQFWNMILQRFVNEPLMFLKKIINWNINIKKQGTTEIPMFLITARPLLQSKRLQLSDLCIVFRKNDHRFLWRIHWQDLTVIEKLHENHIFRENNKSEILNLEGKYVNINDFFGVKTRNLFDEVKIDGNLPDFCFEVLMADENTDIETHLQDDEEGIVLLKEIENGKFIAACTTKEIINNFDLMFYQCTISEGEEQNDKPERYALQDETYVKIDVFTFPIFITSENRSSILMNKHTRYFIVNDTPQVLRFTIEKVAADKHTGAQMSGDHCQEGSDKKISVVFPIVANNINEIKKKLQNNQTKRSRKNL